MCHVLHAKQPFECIPNCGDFTPFILQGFSSPRTVVARSSFPCTMAVPAKIADLAEINPPDQGRALADGDIWIICCFSSPWSRTPHIWEAGQAAVLLQGARCGPETRHSSSFLLPRAWGGGWSAALQQNGFVGEESGLWALKQKRLCRGELRRGTWLLAFPSLMCCLLRASLGGFALRLCFHWWYRVLLGEVKTPREALDVFHPPAMG